MQSGRLDSFRLVTGPGTTRTRETSSLAGQEQPAYMRGSLMSSVCVGSFCRVIGPGTTRTHESRDGQERHSWPSWPQHRWWLLLICLYFVYNRTCFKDFGSFCSGTMPATTRMHKRKSQENQHLANAKAKP